MRVFLSGLATTALIAGCQQGEQQRAEREAQPVQAPPESGEEARPDEAARQGPPAQQGATSAAVSMGGVAVCRPTAQIERSAERLLEMADANRDGRISKVEASGTANFLIGGFFFRADANGDGTVTPEEGREARVEFMNQRPAMASVMREVRGATGKKPLESVARMLDVGYGKPLTLAEARQAARTAVDDLFGWSDTDKDGFISVAEARAAASEGARALGQAAFKAADTDRSGGLSLQEFQNALQGSAQVAFGLSDSNNDGQLSDDEAAVALGQLAGRLGIQSPARAQ
ncbi:uncharacterized protein SOCEGT47_074800 [Sorangium cellulosum]|uniref:EF-hand domain-containing protein n=1 Tax=Sorangium cellulosum TaxID=56 RepID=A0A4P2QB57_SORCE|nr:EF-hand domain-containing protein [Sorangium cellulosum]AUX26910.1 uncharacterized protein SOCEGT47_074800 [Sorangium cellulosum]